MAVAGNEPSLAIAALSHAFGKTQVLHGIDLAVAPGEVVCLLGPSGCGKTTLLRLAAGLERVQSGSIAIGGRVVGGAGIDLPPEARRVGLMFQDFALFPHLDLAANVGFGLSGADARDRAMAWLARVGLEKRAGDYPHRLSGGEQQRVALARALAPAPAVLLMDEPFSNLDTILRQEIRRQTLALLRQSGAATLLVTHDPDEAMAMADRIALLRHGRLVQAGTPRQLYMEPRDRFVAAFLGRANFIPAPVQAGRAVTPLGTVAAPGADGGTALVMVRPESLVLGNSGPIGRVTDVRQVGGLAEIRLSLEPGLDLAAHSLAAQLPRIGDAIGVSAAPDALRVVAE